MIYESEENGASISELDFSKRIYLHVVHQQSLPYTFLLGIAKKIYCSHVYFRGKK